MESNNIFQSIKEASKDLLLLDKEHTIRFFGLADETEQQFDLILQENKKDLDLMDPENPKYDRLN